MGTLYKLHADINALDWISVLMPWMGYLYKVHVDINTLDRISV